MKIKIILKKLLITILSLIIITTQTSSYALAKGLFYDNPRNYNGEKFDINDPETHKGSSYINGKCNSGNLTIFDPTIRGIDTNIDQGNDHCIAYIATFSSILALQGLAVEFFCVQDPIFSTPGIPSPPVIPIDLATQALKGIAGILNCAKRTAEAAALTAVNAGLGAAATQAAAKCCTASSIYGATLTSALSSLAIIYGVAASESKRAVICGSKWNGWKDEENEGQGEVMQYNAIADKGPYQKCILNLFNDEDADLNKDRDGFSNCEEMGFAQEDIEKNKKREMSNKFFREYLFSGIEYIDRSNSACKNPFYSSHDTDKKDYFNNTFGYSTNLKYQRYYFTGPASHPSHNNNFACERFKPLDRKLRDDPEMREAYDCCVKKSLETICIERESEYNFCSAGEKCMMTNVTYYAYRAQKPEHNGHICAHSYSVCPFNYSVGLGTEVLLENKEPGNNKNVNFCQYLNHCVKSGYSTSDFEMNFSGKSGAYISKACKDLRGDSQNYLKYESDILLKNSRHFSAPIAQCFKETIVNFLLNRASDTKCKSSSQGLKVFPDKDGKCPNDEYEYKEGELLDEKYKSILQTIKDKFLQVIKIAMILAVVFFGGTILLSASESLKSKVIFSFLLKFIVVMYFVLGTAWQDYLIEGIIDSSTQMSEMTFIPYKDFIVTDNSRKKNQASDKITKLKLDKNSKIANKDSLRGEIRDFNIKKSDLQDEINNIDKEELPSKSLILQEKRSQKQQQETKISELTRAYSDIMTKIVQFELDIDQYRNSIIELDSLSQRITEENAQHESDMDIAQNAIDSFSKQDLLDIFSTKIQDLDNEFDQYLTGSNPEFLDFKNDIKIGDIQKIDIVQEILDANRDGSLLEKHEAIIANLGAYVAQNIDADKQAEIERIIIDFLRKYQDLELPVDIDNKKAQYQRNKQSIVNIRSTINSADLESISSIDLASLDLSYLNEEERSVIVTQISNFKGNVQKKIDLEKLIEDNDNHLSSSQTDLSSQFTALNSYKKTNIIDPILNQYQKLTTTTYETDIAALDYLLDTNFESFFSIAEADNIQTGAGILQNLQDFMSSKFKEKLDFEDDCFSNFDEDCAETGYIDYFRELADAQKDVDILEDQKKCFYDHKTRDLVSPPCKNGESILLFNTEIESRNSKIDQLKLEITDLDTAIKNSQDQFDAAQAAISARRVNTKMDDCKFPRLNYLDKDDTNIENAQYPPGKSYLKIWDTLDCKILKAIGLTPNISVPNILLIMLAALFTGGLGVIFFIATFIFAFFLIALTLRALHIFIMSIILIALLIYISPITIICILFEKTKKIFDSWSKLLTGNALQPIFLFAYLGIMISMFDYLIIGDATITIPDDKDVTKSTINCKPEGTEINNSIYCIFKIADLGKSDLTGFEALGVGIPILRDLNQERVNHIFKSALLMYIFAKFIDKISDFSARLVNSSRIETDTPGVSAMTKKSYNFARSIQKRGTRVIKGKMSKAKNAAKSIRNDSNQNQGPVNQGAHAVGRSNASATNPEATGAQGNSGNKSQV